MSFDIGVYEEDCDCIDICRSINATYKLCYAGTSYASNRCTPAEKNQIILLNKISKQLEVVNKEEDYI